jgi:hypothetical protein
MRAFAELGVTVFGFLSETVFLHIALGSAVVVGVSEALERERGPIPAKAFIIYSILVFLVFALLWGSVFLNAPWYLMTGIPSVVLACVIVRWCNPMDQRQLFSPFHLWFSRLFIRKARRVSILFLLLGTFLLASWIRFVINASTLLTYGDWLGVGAVTGPILGVGLAVFREYVDGRAPVY